MDNDTVEENSKIKLVTPTQVRQTAIKLLARREHSRLELQQKLQQRGYPTDLIHSQLEKLIEQDLLSEPRFVENYTRSRSLKGYGPARIINELQQRGIAAELIDSYVDVASQEWLNLAQQVRAKKFGKKIPKDFAEKAKQMRFLQYRGFAFQQIQALFSEKD